MNTYEQTRETLKAVRMFLDGYTVNNLELRRMVDAALAAPPRNCEVGTVEEQAQRFYKFCMANSSAIIGMCDSKCPCIDSGDKCHCLTKWAQMPYDEGGAK